MRKIRLYCLMTVGASRSPPATHTCAAHQFISTAPHSAQSAQS
jgi:hypothetical protein